MDGLKWNDRLKTGIELIDRQHQELLMRMGRFYEACEQGAGMGELEELLDFVSEYVQIHFRDEENLMLQYEYPGYPAQLAHHRKATQCIRQMKDIAGGQQAETLDLLKIAGRTIQEWLINHIFTMDMAMAKYIKNRRLETA